MPYTTVFIDSQTGRVFPCDTTMWRPNSERYVMGNLKTESLEEIWKGSIFGKFRKEMYPKIQHPCILGCDPNNRVGEIE